MADHLTGCEDGLAFDLLPAVPPQSAPGWVERGPLADPASPYGYVEVDKRTLQHPRHRNVFALGDVANLPTSKTGAAVRKQAPVLVADLPAEINGEHREQRRYDGYTPCPLVTARGKVLLAEFDSDQRPAPSIPLLDTTKECRDMWLLKRYGLPAPYWRGMLKGLVQGVLALALVVAHGRRPVAVAETPPRISPGIPPGVSLLRWMPDTPRGTFIRKEPYPCSSSTPWSSRAWATAATWPAALARRSWSIPRGTSIR
ncbi:hypothetical protein [Streptomyces sp. NPDC096311]|uniref:hypothetical protein n=1 Tax=Streptomyces sp. NPDC096311 TaxID=3366083 RepID=UPI0037FF34E4